MRVVRSSLGWTHIPDIDTQTSSGEDKPLAAPKQEPLLKVSVNP